MATNVSNVTARVYAQALLEIGLEKDNTGAIMADLEAVYEVMLGSKDVRNYYESPKISKQEKAALIDKMFKDRVEPQVLSLLHLLARKNRGPILDNIVLQLRELRDKAQDIVHADVQSAQVLTDELRGLLSERIAAATGKKVVLDETVTPGLLGGLVVRVGDKLIDGSLRHQLQLLRKRALAGAD